MRDLLTSNFRPQFGIETSRMRTPRKTLENTLHLDQEILEKGGGAENGNLHAAPLDLPHPDRAELENDAKDKIGEANLAQKGQHLPHEIKFVRAPVCRPSQSSGPGPG